jgi:hypothetical protein
MCKRKQKLSEEQREARREKRSKFLSRMVDEFKKVVLIALFPLFAGTIIWSLILYTMGITPTVSPTIPIAAMGFLSGAYFIYCSSASKDKDSLNKNGLIKNAAGVIKKAVGSVSSVVSSVTSTSESTTEDSGDSDETPISSCKK